MLEIHWSIRSDEIKSIKESDENKKTRKSLAVFKWKKMNPETLIDTIKESFTDILSMDLVKQQRAIEKIYECECQLQNPYMVLHGKQEIITSYKSLITTNMDLNVIIHSVSFDPVQQVVLMDLLQFIRPKALGGLFTISIHQFLKLQLESNQDLFYIVNHNEVHSAQNFISQMPIVGSWYDGSLREAMGQISMAGSSFMEHVGLLDLVPNVVKRTQETAESVLKSAEHLTNKAVSIGSSALNKTGVSFIMSSMYASASEILKDAKQSVKWGASSLLESGRGDSIDCYSSSCSPGQLCYSPTCPRGKTISFVSKSAIQDIIRGMYLGVGNRTNGLLYVFNKSSS